MNEPDVSELISVSQAIEIIDASGAATAPQVEEIALAESDGRRLAEPVHADRDYPPFDKSLMDGYAVRAADAVAGDAPAGGAELAIVGEIPAGRESARALARGEAMAIMTGAPLPPGADGVVPIEEVQCDGNRVRIGGVVIANRYIARRGSDVRAGQVVLERGVCLGPAQLAVAASVGAARVRVYRRPVVAVLATGDELVPIDQPPGAAQIRNSNNIMLVSLLKRLECDVADLGIVRDQPQEVETAIASAMAQADVLFITGGMSMGQYDYVPRTLLKLGVDLKITKLRIKPGKPFVFGRREEKAVFGLPGNPVSAFVCTVRLAARLLAKMGGADPEPRWRSGVIVEPLPANGPREFYQPAVLGDDGKITALKWKGSADLYTLSRANILLPRGENAAALPAGASVRVLEV